MCCSLLRSQFKLFPQIKTVETLQTGGVELFTVTVVLSEPAPGTGWHCLTVIH